MPFQQPVLDPLFVCHIEPFLHFVQSFSRSLQISVDGDLGTTVIRVLDTETDELVRQIPSEEILQVARFIESQTAVDSATPSAVLGLLVDQEG